MSVSTAACEATTMRTRLSSQQERCYFRIEDQRASIGATVRMLEY